MTGRRLTLLPAALALAILFTATTGGCIFAGPYNSDIEELRAIDKPESKCPRLIPYLEIGPRLIGYPALNARDALVECGPDALPALKAAIQDRAYNDRARRLMLDAIVAIVDREAIYMLMQVARDKTETDDQRVEAIDLLVELNAREAMPMLHKLYVDDTQPRCIRRAARSAYRDLEY